jgi:alpha-L-rhamnosidase
VDLKEKIMLKIEKLYTEYRENPIGIDITHPRFFWILESDRKDTKQKSYAIIVSSPDGEAWNTGIVQSDKSIHVEYAGKELKPATVYTIVVTIIDTNGQSASAQGSFETGLLCYENIKTRWITHGYADDIEPCPVYFRDFSLSGEVKSARIYASALGVYDLSLNGKKVGDSFFAPGWTSYKTRVQYQTYDITHMLKQHNHIEISVGNGWYKGIFGFADTSNHYGVRTAALLQLTIEYTDGDRETLVTDQNWQYTTGFRRYSEIYNGETIDYTATPDMAGKAVILDHPVNILVGQESEPVRITKRLKAKQRIITPKGELVLDFGQNLVGIVEAKLHCPRGTVVTLRHAEVLDKDSNFYTENLRGAKATDTFICSGGEDVFLPTFTFHGFRYLCIEGLGDKADTSCFTACVLHTDMRETGRFSCSHPAVTQLQSNIQWGQRGNFLDIPTDCPQRDERLGWTGDAQVFAATAAYNMNTALFFTKWLRDLAAEQTTEHGVPHVIPNILGDSEGAAAWSDAAVIIPWAMYLFYGDIRLLHEQYPSMKSWVEYIRSKAGNRNLWQTGFQYADWLALDKEEGADRVGATDIYLVASAYYAYSAGIVAETAEILGSKKDAAEYRKLREDIVAAFQKEYITQTGRMVSETQTSCVLALHFDLVQKEYRERILASLVNNIARHNNHLVTGFVGTPYLCHTLSNNGRHNLAGTVFLKCDYPSWLYAVDLGATTIWERWNSMMEDGSIADSSMNSFNHYAYGSIGDWMYQKLGGLQIIEPGFKKSRIAPMPIKGISWADAGIKTMYGELCCHWDYKDHYFSIDITIPANTTAMVFLPGKEEEFGIGSGTYHYEYETDLEQDDTIS